MAALKALGYRRPADVPRGAIVAAARLVACHCVEDIRDDLSATERGWGNYDDGRYAYELAHIRRIEPPILCRGMPGLYDAPLSVAQAVVVHLGGEATRLVERSNSL